MLPLLRAVHVAVATVTVAQEVGLTAGAVGHPTHWDAAGAADGVLMVTWLLETEVSRININVGLETLGRARRRRRSYTKSSQQELLGSNLRWRQLQKNTLPCDSAQ